MLLFPTWPDTVLQGERPCRASECPYRAKVTWAPPKGPAPPPSGEPSLASLPLATDQPVRPEPQLPSPASLPRAVELFFRSFHSEIPKGLLESSKFTPLPLDIGAKRPREGPTLAQGHTAGQASSGPRLGPRPPSSELPQERGGRGSLAQREH